MTSKLRLIHVDVQPVFAFDHAGELHGPCLGPIHSVDAADWATHAEAGFPERLSNAAAEALTRIDELPNDAEHRLMHVRIHPKFVLEDDNGYRCDVDSGTVVVSAASWPGYATGDFAESVRLTEADHNVEPQTEVSSNPKDW
jgi:hypothetical protein